MTMQVCMDYKTCNVRRDIRVVFDLMWFNRRQYLGQREVTHSSRMIFERASICPPGIPRNQGYATQNVNRTSIVMRNIST